MKQKINVGIIGLGTVGSGAFRILRDNAELIRHRVGVPIDVVKIAVRDVGRDRGLDIPPSLLTDKPSLIVDDPNIDIVVELMGGYEPAKELILAAIARGKHLVTANKALLAVHGTEIHTAARRAGVAIGFEGSVAGGIPVIKVLQEALAANRILSIYGIINGTSNYILTKMTDEGRPFEDVLREAQRAGYAEADPTFDVGGIDTAHKLAILVNLAFGLPITLQDILTEGVTAISPLDIDFGKTLGYTVKLTEKRRLVCTRPWFLTNIPSRKSAASTTRFRLLVTRAKTSCCTDAAPAQCRPAVPSWATLSTSHGRF